MGARYPADSGAAPPGAVSRLNSSETALAGAATFTGEWEDLLDFAGFSVACKVTPTNASGALYVDFSNDGVTEGFSEIAGRASTVFQSLRSFPAKTDLWASAIGPTGNGPVDANYDLVLVAD